MLRVTFEIIPFGTPDKKRHRQIGSLEISLEFNQDNIANYTSRMFTDNVYVPTNPRVEIVGHNRDNGAFELVHRCLEAHLTPQVAPKKASKPKKASTAHLKPLESSEKASKPSKPAKAKKARKSSKSTVETLANVPKCAGCGNSDLIGVEYFYDHPCYYDGVSEWRCKCGTRTGRWTHKILNEEEYERPYGL